MIEYPPERLGERVMLRGGCVPLQIWAPDSASNFFTARCMATESGAVTTRVGPCDWAAPSEMPYEFLIDKIETHVVFDHGAHRWADILDEQLRTRPGSKVRLPEVIGGDIMRTVSGLEAFRWSGRPQVYVLTDTGPVPE